MFFKLHAENLGILLLRILWLVKFIENTHFRAFTKRTEMLQTLKSFNHMSSFWSFCVSSFEIAISHINVYPHWIIWFKKERATFHGWCNAIHCESVHCTDMNVLCMIWLSFSVLELINMSYLCILYVSRKHFPHTLVTIYMYCFSSDCVIPHTTCVNWGDLNLFL